MDDMPPRPEIEQLLEHRDFLRALASQLVADPGTQDDLVSDALEERALRTLKLTAGSEVQKREITVPKSAGYETDHREPHHRKRRTSATLWRT
jgi:hypothetical protein